MSLSDMRMKLAFVVCHFFSAISLSILVAFVLATGIKRSQVLINVSASMCRNILRRRLTSKTVFPRMRVEFGYVPADGLLASPPVKSSMSSLIGWIDGRHSVDFSDGYDNRYVGLYHFWSLTLYADLISKPPVLLVWSSLWRASGKRIWMDNSFKHMVSVFLEEKQEPIVSSMLKARFF